MNRTDLQALTLAGPTVTRPVQDPLAVLSLDKQLFIIFQAASIPNKFFFKQDFSNDEGSPRTKKLTYETSSRLNNNNNNNINNNNNTLSSKKRLKETANCQSVKLQGVETKPQDVERPMTEPQDVETPMTEPQDVETPMTEPQGVETPMTEPQSLKTQTAEFQRLNTQTKIFQSETLKTQSLVLEDCQNAASIRTQIKKCHHISVATQTTEPQNAKTQTECHCQSVATQTTECHCQSVATQTTECHCQNANTQTTECHCQSVATQTTECLNVATQTTTELQSIETQTEERRSVRLLQATEHQSYDTQTLSDKTEADEIEISKIQKTKKLKRRDKNFIFKFFQPTVLLNRMNLWSPKQLLSIYQQPTVIRKQPTVLCEKCGCKLSTASSKPDQTRKIREKFSDETFELDDWCDIRVINASGGSNTELLSISDGKGLFGYKVGIQLPDMFGN